MVSIFKSIPLILFKGGIKMWDGWINIPFAPKYQFNIWTNSVREIRSHKKKQRDVLPDGTAVYTFLVDGQLVKFKPYELRELILKGGDYIG